MKLNKNECSLSIVKCHGKEEPWSFYEKLGGLSYKTVKIIHISQVISSLIKSGPRYMFGKVRTKTPADEIRCMSVNNDRGWTFFVFKKRIQLVHTSHLAGSNLTSHTFKIHLTSPCSNHLTVTDCVRLEQKDRRVSDARAMAVGGLHC